MKRIKSPGEKSAESLKGTERSEKYMHYYIVGFNRGFDQGYELAAERYERNLIKLVKQWKRSKR